MAYEAIAIANEFLKRAEDSGQKLTPMKLQKLVYFAHGWYLALIHRPLLLESVQAWQFGPVVRDLYQACKEYGSFPIESKLKRERYKDGKSSFYVPTLSDYHDDDERQSAHSVIDGVWKSYSPYSAERLSNATHQDGTPWKKFFSSSKREVVIPNDEIESYFERLKKQ